jgi:hypothetical protein
VADEFRAPIEVSTYGPASFNVLPGFTLMVPPFVSVAPEARDSVAELRTSVAPDPIEELADKARVPAEIVRVSPMIDRL